MQRTLLTILAGLLLAAPAQAFVDQRIEAHVPFRFVVEKTSFAPGHYVIEPVGAANPSALKIQKANGTATLVVLTQSITGTMTSDEPRLVFKNRGGRRVLQAVFGPGSETGSEIVRVASPVKVPSSSMARGHRVTLHKAAPCPCPTTADNPPRTKSY